jgi:hypothetical protein
MQKWTLAALAACFALPAMAQDQSAWDNADANAAFKRCGTRMPSEIERLAIEEWLLDSREARIKAQGKKPSWAGGPGNDSDPGPSGGCADTNSCAYAIDVYVHIIEECDSNECKIVSAGMVAEQIAVLNKAYGGTDVLGGPNQIYGDMPDYETPPENTGFTFTLAGTTWHQNSTWYNARPNSQAEEDMKTTIRGSTMPTEYKKELHMYLTGGGGYLGWAYFPTSIDDSYWWLDGVVVMDRSLPGGGTTVYSEGDTATHEVGHWLGLYHTFDGGCQGSGDLIADTEPERSANYGCPFDRNTCKGKDDTGPDPIFNFMDYTDDACMYQFTADQAFQMNLVATEARKFQ